jgi:cytochrome P450
MRAPRGRLRDGIRLLGTTDLPAASIFPTPDTDAVEWAALGRRYLVTRSPRHVEQVFVEGFDRFPKSTHYRLLAAVTGEGLLTSEGPTWERQRRLIQPVLGRRQIDGLVPPMVEATAAYLDRFRPHGVVDLSAEMTEVTLDVVGRALFGTGLSGYVDRLRPAVTEGMDIALLGARLQLLLGLPRWLIDAAGTALRRFPMPWPLSRIRRVMRTIDDVVTELVDQRVADGTGRSADLLDLLLGLDIPRDLVRDELVTMMLAGHETTANALSWLWYLLATHPDAYQRHIDEVAAVVGDRPPTAAEVEQLPWTSACLQEAMRLHPPAWVLEREAAVDTELDGGVRVRRRTTILFPVHLIHRDPRWWDDPMAFRPERFLPGAPHPRRGTYLPFGAGRRICVASSFAITEGTLIATMITQRHRFTRAETGPPGERATVTLRPARLGMLVSPAGTSSPRAGAGSPTGP